MCYFIMGISETEVSQELIEKLEKVNLFVRDYTNYVKDAKKGLYYYDISNGHCACELAVNPYSKITEVKSVISELGNKGAFRFVVIDSECDDEFLLQEENQELEKLLEGFSEKTISAKELLKLYPEGIVFDTIYDVKS